MSNNLSQIIFDQFLEIVEGKSKKSCLDFDECDFEYRVRERIGHKLLDVIYIAKDNCGRRRDVIISIDITNICLEDLISCRWVDYLERLACEFINDICPKKLVIIKDEPKKCRPQPPKWNPFPCGTVKTIVRKRKPVIDEPECEVIVEGECECVPICERVACKPKEQIIVRYENEKPWKCGDFSRLVEEPEKKRVSFGTCRGNTDYNNQIWVKDCCASCRK